MAFKDELENLFLENYDEWCLISYFILKDKDEAEDTVQDVFVKVLLRGKETEIENLKAYIATAIRNKSLKNLSHSRKYCKLPDNDILLSPSSVTDEAIFQLELESQIQQALETLPDQRKNVFEKCVIHGQKYQTVAETLGISVNTVKYHVKQAYKSLRVQLKDTYFWLIIFIIFST